MWRKIWLPIFHVVELVGGVGALRAVLKFRPCAVDHAKLARLEMLPNAYRQHHQCPRTRVRSPSTAGVGAGDTAVTGGLGGLVSSFAAAFGTGAFSADDSSSKRWGATLRLVSCAGAPLSIRLRGAHTSQSSSLQSHTNSHVFPSVGIDCARCCCSASCFSRIIAFGFVPFFVGAIVVTATALRAAHEPLRGRLRTLRSVYGP